MGCECWCRETVSAVVPSLSFLFPISHLAAFPALVCLLVLPDLSVLITSHRLPAQLPQAPDSLPRPARPPWTGRACLLVYIPLQSPLNIIISTATRPSPTPRPATSFRPDPHLRPRSSSTTSIPTSRPLTPSPSTRTTPSTRTRTTHALTVASPTRASSPRRPRFRPDTPRRPRTPRKPLPPRPRHTSGSNPRTRPRTRVRSRHRTRVTSINAGSVFVIADCILLLTVHHRSPVLALSVRLRCFQPVCSITPTHPIPNPSIHIRIIIKTCPIASRTWVSTGQ